uniref:Putative ovule protein n=1 Tax=Solanum chacoense TaxID=4108 RepID=A0A0V0H1C0_SOLCH
MSRQGDLMVQQIRETHGGEILWNLRFRWHFHDWEVTKLQRLIALLHKQVIQMDKPNALSWVWEIMELYLLNNFMRNF